MEGNNMDNLKSAQLIIPQTKKGEFIFHNICFFLLVTYLTILIILNVQTVYFVLLAGTLFLWAVVIFITIFYKKTAYLSFDKIIFTRRKKIIKDLAISEVSHISRFSKGFFASWIIILTNKGRQMKIILNDTNQAAVLIKLYPDKYFEVPFFPTLSAARWIFNLLLLIIVTIPIMSLLFFIPLLLMSEKDYNGQHPSLYTAAVNSLINISSMSPKIQIISTDDYGRQLYSFNCYESHNLLVAQKNDKSLVYYYPNVNSISHRNSYLDTDKSQYFTSLDIEILKEKNDWNEEINLDKCISNEISRNSSRSKLALGENEITPFFKNYMLKQGYGEDEYKINTTKFAFIDDYGRELYYTKAIKQLDNMSLYYNVMYIFNIDGSISENQGVVQINNIYKYQEDLAVFKAINNWNLPL